MVLDTFLDELHAGKVHTMIRSFLEGQGRGSRARLQIRAHPTFTGTSVIVSLPKISITLTATV